jgi:hypothetical protein
MNEVLRSSILGHLSRALFFFLLGSSPIPGDQEYPKQVVWIVWVQSGMHSRGRIRRKTSVLSAMMQFDLSFLLRDSEAAAIVGLATGNDFSGVEGKTDTTA